MQVQTTLSNFNGESSPFLPWNVVVWILKIRPQWTFGAIFKNDTIMRVRSNSLKLDKILLQGTLQCEDVLQLPSHGIRWGNLSG